MFSVCTFFFWAPEAKQQNTYTQWWTLKTSYKLVHVRAILREFLQKDQMSCFYDYWSSLCKNKVEGKVVKGDMLSAESWMVTAQKKLDVGAGEKSEKDIVLKKTGNKIHNLIITFAPSMANRQTLVSFTCLLSIDSRDDLWTRVAGVELLTTAGFVPSPDTLGWQMITSMDW